MKATLFNTNELHWPKLMHEMGLANVIEHHFASHLIGRSSLIGRIRIRHHGSG